MIMIVARLTAAFGEKVLEQDGPRFDEKAIADRRSQQRLNGRHVRRAAAIGASKEPDASREQWRILRAPIPDRAEQGQNEGGKLCGPCHFRENKAQYRTRHMSHSSEMRGQICL